MLGEYRAQRTHVVNALIMLSFFGGLALALLVTMLALMRIVWGGQLWLPTVVAMLCCVIVTTVSNDPSRMQPVEVAAVGLRRSPAEAGEAATQRSAVPPAESQLRRLAEKLAKFGNDAEELKADRFPVQQYAPREVNGAATAENRGKPIAWIPC